MLWSLIVNNCWPNLTIQSVATDNNPWEILYFVTFIVTTVVIIFNIVVGFILDVISAYLNAAIVSDVEADDEKNIIELGFEGMEDLTNLDDALKKMA